MSKPDKTKFSFSGLYVFLAFFLPALLLRLWPVFAISQSWEDGYFYLELARSLARGKYELMGVFHTKYLPGYPFFVLICHTLGLGFLPWFKSAQMASALCSAALPGLGYFLGRELSSDQRAGVAAGLFALFNAHLVTFSGVPFSETFFSMLVLLTLLLAPRRPLLAGALAGWAGVTRHQGGFLAAVFLLLLLFPQIFPGGAKPKEAKRLQLFGGLLVMGGIILGWWILARIAAGKWPFEIYAEEMVQRGPILPKAGLHFLLLSFPVAGHLATLCALPGLFALIRRKESWPLLLFFLLFAVLHGFWMFGVERYFIPLVPLVSVLAGSGLSWGVEKVWRGEGKPRRKNFLLLALAGLFALSHFLGFAPAMVKEESLRTSGYRVAIEYVSRQPGAFSVLAYDAFMVSYHDGKHPVIPSGMLGAENWGFALPALYYEKNCRWIIWSDLYPADREKWELAEPDWFVVPGVIERNGQKIAVEVKVMPDQSFSWELMRPARGWLRPWRKEIKEKAVVNIYRLLPEKSPDLQ